MTDTIPPPGATAAGSAAAAELPLAGCRVLERSRSVACAYAGRLLAAMGAEVLLLEDPGGSPLRQAPPWLAGGSSALFAYLAAGKDSRVLDLQRDDGLRAFDTLLAEADILLDDTPLAARDAMGRQHDTLCARHESLVCVSVLPFGTHGPKAQWDGEEINLVHAGGEGFLLPNGLSQEQFPDRAPLKIHGHFAGQQGGCAAALAALAAWWAVPRHGGQAVDVSVQDAVLGVSAFALQRLGDGSLEHRATRSFRYGGVFATADGFIELLTLEDRQWQGLVELIGRPEWALDEALNDGLERSRRGAAINERLRAFMHTQSADDVVQRAQQLGVPVARYRTPAEVVQGAHERARGLFAPLVLDDGSTAQVLVAPFQFRETPLRITRGVPALGQRGKERDIEGEAPTAATTASPTLETAK